MGWQKAILAKKNLLDDLPGVKRRKLRKTLAKKPTSRLTRGEKKKI